MKTSLEDEAAAMLAEIAHLEQVAANAPVTTRDRKGVTGLRFFPKLALHF